MYVCMYIDMYTYMYLFNVYISLSLYICVYIYIYIYIHISYTYAILFRRPVAVDHPLLQALRVGDWSPMYINILDNSLYIYSL